MESGSLDGNVVIVTGASRRVGRSYALALAKAGATVVALARTMGDDPTRFGTLAEVAAAGRKAGHEVHAYRCDLADEDEILRTVDDVVARFGGIDAVINNAVAEMGRIDGLAVPRDIWDAQMRVNVRAPYVLTAASAPHMIARGGGSIVNVTSLSGSTPSKDSGAHEGLVHYGVSKAALNRLTTWFAIEFADANIAVNSISPGDADAYMRLVNNAADGPEVQLSAGNQLDQAFWGNPIVYLAGARPADVTGQILHTYTFGESWGPRYPTPPAWSPEVLKILGRT